MSSLIVGTIVGIAIFAIIIAWVGFDNVWEQRRSLNLTYLWLYLAFAILTYVLRALRFQLLLGNLKGATIKLYGVVSIHTLMINLLPFSSGEVSYPILLKRYGISSGFMQGVPSIIMARMQDGVIYISLLLAALIWTGYIGLVLEWTIGSFPLVTALSAAVMLVGAAIVYRTFGHKIAIIGKINELIAKAVSSFRDVPLKIWAASFVIAFAARFIAMVGVFVLFKSIDINLPISTIFLITSLYVFLPYLPINTPAGIGITEGYLLAFFIQSGIDEGVAAAASIQTHFIQLMVAAILGGVGFLILQALRRREIPNNQPVVGQEVRMARRRTGN